MFEAQRHRSGIGTAFRTLELIYHSTVRDVRKTHRSAVMGFLMNVVQTAIFVLTFYVMFELLGLRGSAIRGDFLLYLMSGIFLYMTHIKSVRAVMSADGPTSPMMQHAPMNTAVAICAAAISSLYQQILSMFMILFVYHMAFTPIVIDDPAGAMGMMLVAWFTGVAVGVVFLALKPWMPDFVSIASSLYIRANMIASGKMFVANTLPATMLVLFDWNPLFHAIDQARGYTFIHYNPHFSSPTYPIYVAMVLLLIGLMGEFYTRNNISASRNAGR